MNKIPVSVTIITKNEAINIEDAIKSVIDFDEIIVVDAFSDDATIEICKKYSVTIYQNEWPGFSAQKQFAVDRAKNNWVLSLDADERITAELKNEIRDAISNYRYSGYYIPRKNIFLGKWIRHSGWWPDYTLKLFKKDVSRFDDREVHEKVIVNGDSARLKNPMEHYSYRDISDFIKKMDNYSILAAKDIIQKDKGKSTLVFDMLSRPLFVFLKMYFLQLGFLDGRYGFYLAILYSFYTFLKYARALEIKEK